MASHPSASAPGTDGKKHKLLPSIHKYSATRSRIRPRSISPHRAKPGAAKGKGAAAKEVLSTTPDLSDEKIHHADLELLASVLPPLHSSAGGLDMALAKQVASELMHHVVYVRLMYHELIHRKKDPSGALHPRKTRIPRDITLIPRLPFAKYVKGLVYIIKEGDAARKATLLCRIGYAHAYEGHVTWTEALYLIKAHVKSIASTEEAVHRLYQAFAQKAATEEIKAGVEKTMHTGQSFIEELIIPIAAFIELMADGLSFAQSLPLAIDLETLIRDARRFEMAEDLALARPWVA